MDALSRSEFAAALHAQGAFYWDKHPFSLRLSAGECTPDEVRAWVGNRWYYQSNLSQKNAAIIANCPLPDVRVRWVERIKFQDEGGLEDWLVLAKAVGISDIPAPLPGVRFAIDAYVRFCKENRWYLGAAAALTELFAPDAMRDRVLAWRRNYPWIDDSGYAYFESRIPVVRNDSAYTLGLVLDFCSSRDDQEAAIAALRFKCDVLWAMLDAISTAGHRP
jgi:pyrroloquinoline-quinone synthase